MSRPLALALCLAAAACSKKKEAAPAAAAGSAAEPGSGTNASQRLTRRIQPTAPTRKPGSTETEPPGMPGEGSGSAGARPGSGSAIKGPLASALHKRELTFDRDGDGQLSDQERRAMQLARSNALMRRLDADQNGTVNKAELESSRFRGFITSFELADANHDGVLTHPELGAAMDQSTRARAVQRARQRAGSGAGSGSAPP